MGDAPGDFGACAALAFPLWAHLRLSFDAPVLGLVFLEAFGVGFGSVSSAFGLWAGRGDFTTAVSSIGWAAMASAGRALTAGADIAVVGNTCCAVLGSSGDRAVVFSLPVKRPLFLYPPSSSQTRFPRQIGKAHG